MSTASEKEVHQTMCSECGEDIKLGSFVFCRGCALAAQEEAFNEGVEAEQHEQPGAVKTIREWAQRRFVMGQISREVRDELEQCAADIEVGHR